MGGGDLNLKKSWHPNTMKNQERVWKAEQADAAEKRKLAELKQEISAERNREELHRIGQTSGVLPGGLSGSGGASDKKLEWMYKGSENLVNREEYLMGRQVDKSFEAQVAAEREAQKQALVGVTKPKNHVEHECIPFSIRQFHGVKVSEEQVDLQRKISEDPLMAIRQREMDTRKKLLENPVKLKEIHRLLRTEGKLALKQKATETEHGVRKSKLKKVKKSKKSKKKRSKNSRSSDDENTADGSDDEADLDAILAKKYKQLQGDDDGATMNIEMLLKVKYKKLSAELDKMGGRSHSKNKKRKHGDRDAANDSPEPAAVTSSRRHSNPFSKQSDPSREVTNEAPIKRDASNRRAAASPAPKRRLPSPRSSRRNPSPVRHKRPYSRSPTRDSRRRSPLRRSTSRDHLRQRSSSRDQFNRSKDLKRTISPSRNKRAPRNTRQSPSAAKKRRSLSPVSRYGVKESVRTERSPSPHRRQRSTSKQRQPNKFQTVSSRKPVVSRSSSSCSSATSSSSDTSNTTDSEAEAAKRAVIASRNYGLVTAAGDKIAIKPSSTAQTANTNTIDQKTSSGSRKPHGRPDRPAKLSDEEKQRRLAEMQSNAEWRDDERRRNVSKYRAEEKREKDARSNETFDRDYINKELHKAIATQNSVESRLRANKNNIQRSSGAMDSNFAKR